MYKTNCMNDGEFSHSRDYINVYENRENKKRKHLYKTLTDDSFVNSLENLFKALLSIMLITLTVVSFVGIACSIVMLILDIPMGALVLIFTIIAFAIFACVTGGWFCLVID